MTKPTIPAAGWPPAVEEARRHLATQHKRHQLLTELGHRYLYGY
jgi:hypothetical protein